MIPLRAQLTKNLVKAQDPHPRGNFLKEFLCRLPLPPERLENLAYECPALSIILDEAMYSFGKLARVTCVEMLATTYEADPVYRHKQEVAEGFFI